MRSVILFLTLCLASSTFGQRFVKVVNTYADLVALNPNDVHTNVFVAGRTSVNDGGQGTFTYNSASSATTNRGIVFKPTGYSGRFIRQYSGAISAQWFATGDGSTDDTAALQNCINSTPSGQVMELPDTATFLITNVVVNTNITIKGFGTIKQSSSAASIGLLTTVDDSNNATIIFRDFHLDGNKAQRSAYQTSTVANASLVYTHNTYKNLKCNNVTFQNAVRANATFGGSAEFVGCTFTGMQVVAGSNSCFNIYGIPHNTNNAAYFRMDNCDVFSTQTAAVSVASGSPCSTFITENPDETNPDGSQHVFRKIIITNNRVWGHSTQYGGDVMVGFEIYNGGKEINITGNSIDGYRLAGIKAQRCDNVTIANNFVLNGTNSTDNAGWGIMWTPLARETSSPFTGSRLGEQHYNCSIVDNKIISAPRYGISVTGSRFQVKGNTIDTVYRTLDTAEAYGIDISLMGDGDVEGNILRNVRGEGIYGFVTLTGTNVTLTAASQVLSNIDSASINYWNVGDYVENSAGEGVNIPSLAYVIAVNRSTSTLTLNTNVATTATNITIKKIIQNVTIRGNQITEEGDSLVKDGIFLNAQTRRFTVVDNTVRFRTNNIPYYGIYSAGSWHSFNHNTFERTYHGIELAAGIGYSVDGNVSESCQQYGVDLVTGVSNSRINFNRADNCVGPLQIGNCTNIWVTDNALISRNITTLLNVNASAKNITVFDGGAGTPAATIFGSSGSIWRETDGNGDTVMWFKSSGDSVNNWVNPYTTGSAIGAGNLGTGSTVSTNVLHGDRTWSQVSSNDVISIDVSQVVGLRIVSGAGSPEGSITKTVGWIYLRTDGGAGTTLYVKESGSGNTGWAAK